MGRRIRPIWALWLGPAMLGAGPAGAQSVIHVATTGNDANDGSTWALAKQTVQAALDAAPSGGQVWVAAGTYVERITLKDGVALYGGFAGNETTLTQRDWSSHETILDGNRGGSVVTAPFGATATTRIDGFTIRNGTGTLAGAFYRYGGGIHCDNSSPVIVHNRITANTASYGGGGIFCSGNSSATIAHNLIVGNTASSYGGGVYCSYASPMILGNTLTGNVAFYGGGAYCAGGSPLFANNAVVGNTVSSHGGGIYSAYSSPTVTNNTITENRATTDGAGIYCAGGSPAVANTIVVFNTSGIFRTAASTLTLSFNCVFGNTAYDYAGLADPTGVNGNIAADPLFVRTPSPGPDGQWATADDDYGDLRLQGRSPCVDAGDNAAVPSDVLDADADAETGEPLPFDRAGHTRFVDAPAVTDTGRGPSPVVDLGAYEFIPGDFDADGDVDLDDFVRYQACFNGPNRPAPAADCDGADFDGDTDVDLTDFQTLQACFNGPNRPPACE